jgi:hypothetical protein
MPAHPAANFRSGANLVTQDQSIINEASNMQIPRKKTLSEAALAANRANAKKCTGP